MKHGGKTPKKRLPQKATNSASVSVKTDMSMELNSSFKKILWMPSWDVDLSLALLITIRLKASPFSITIFQTNMSQQLIMVTMALKTSMVSSKPSGRWTWHYPRGEYHNQIDYIIVRRRFQSSVNFVKTRGFAGVDLGSYHEHVMKNQGKVRTRFSLEKLKDHNITDFFEQR